MKSFKRFLSEGISIKDDKLKIEYKPGKSDTGDITLSLGQGTFKGKNKFKPFMTKSERFLGAKIYSTYAYKHSKDSTEILKSLKGKGKYKVELDVLRQFIKRTAIYSHSFLKNENIDLLMLPESTSMFLTYFGEEMKSRFPESVYLPASFHKSELNKIKINYKHPKINDYEIEVLEKTLKHVKQVGYLEMKKVPKSMTEFIDNILFLDKNLESKVEGKNILVLDDVLSSGRTFEEMIKSLHLYSPNKIVGLSVFKSH